MRIISGKAGRIAIKVPKAVTRPTTDFVRQALFSMLGERVSEARVLDLFAGSGAMGLEALSRGASSCAFVEEHRAAEKVIKENLAKARLSGGRIILSDVHGWVRRDNGEYDLIVADPPYAKTALDRDHLKELLEDGAIIDRLAMDGLLILEQSSEEATRSAEGLTLVDRRSYGGTAILLYAHKKDS